MKNGLPSISLVTCSYQQARFLDATIRSVLAQGYPALEYLVIDGASKDGSADIIARHSESLAYWVSERDSGQTEALVKGFRKATGEINGWLCSDDLLLPGSLEAVGRFFQDHPDVEAVYGDSIWIDANGKAIRPKKEMDFDHFVFHHDHNFIPQPSMFWRRRLYDAVGGLNADYNLAMDSDLWDRFAARTPIAHVSRYLSCMRYYAEQKTRSLRPHGRKEDEQIRLRSSPWARTGLPLPLLHVIARGRRVLRKSLAGGYFAKVPQDLLPWLQAHETPAR